MMLGPLFHFFGKLMPTCYRALDMAEKGCERPLSIKEKIVLKYNSRLCMHCNCAEERFKCLTEKMKEAAKKRNRE